MLCNFYEVELINFETPKNKNNVMKYYIMILIFHCFDIFQ